MLLCRNLADVPPVTPEATLRGDSESLSSSTDSALEKSADVKHSDSASKPSNLSNGKLKLKKKHQANKSSDSNHSDDSAVDVVGKKGSGSDFGEGSTLKIYTSEDDNSSPNLCHGRISSLKEGEQQKSLDSKQRSLDTQSVDSNSAVASTRATTGADTPTTTLQDSVGELRSSTSSLTSVTSRASFLSPVHPDGGPDDLSSPPLSSRFTKSLKGRLTGAISYWTGGNGAKERPGKGSPQSFPATPACSPTGEEEEMDKEEPYPMSPASGAPLVFPELQQNPPPCSPPDDTASAVPSLQPSPPELFATLEGGDCGLPLPLFSKGYLVHPYLSLQQLEVLSAPTTRAFLAGASNTLFLHKRPLYHVLVQVKLSLHFLITTIFS